MRKNLRSHMLSVAGVVLLTVAALTACTSTESNVGASAEVPTSNPPASPSPQEARGGLQVDSEAFQQFMMTCMAEKGWAVVAAPDGAVSPADSSYSTESAFNDALTGCIEDAAIPYLDG